MKASSNFLVLVLLLPLIFLCKFHCETKVPEMKLSYSTDKELNNLNEESYLKYDRNKNKWDKNRRIDFSRTPQFKDCPDLNCISGNESIYPKDEPCKNHILCSINYEPRITRQINPACDSLSECVTAVIKTSGEREYMLVQLIESVWTFYPELSFVIISDDKKDITMIKELQLLINGSGRIYYEYSEKDIGIGGGRMLGIEKVITPYVLLMDDDFIFTPKTKIDILLEVILSTNLSVVGGTTDKACNFFGTLYFQQKENKTTIKHVQNTIYGSVDGYKNCFVVDIVKNFFIAKRADILSSGGWNKDLKVAEHEDFFLKLKVNEKGVSICPEVYVYHDQVNDRIRLKRKQIFRHYRKKLMRFWKIDEIDLCMLTEERAIKC